MVELRRRSVFAGILASAMPLTATVGATSSAPEAVRAIAKEAYIYGFPLVDSYRIQYSYFVDKTGSEYKGAWNQIHNNARVYTPEDKSLQTPNSDTPYSQLGADLRAEPLVLTVPEIEKGRYYSLQFIDMYTFDFAYVGSRATGNGAGNFMLAGPNWKGPTPKGIKLVIPCETEFAFVLYRTQLFNADDIENVKKIQASYKVQPLSQFLGQSPPASAPAINFIKPLSAKRERTSLDFFQELNFILQFCPTDPSEQSMMRRFAEIGVGPGKSFQSNNLSPLVKIALTDGMADAWCSFKDYKSTELDTGKKSSANGFGTRAFLNGGYIDRMAAAVLGIYGNAKEEAIYPTYFVDSKKQKLSGTNHYTIHFGSGDLPPANAFWSLTLYALPSSLLYANPLNRYLINSPMLPGLKRDRDGGITLYVQNTSPSADNMPNWLPAPAGPFLLCCGYTGPKRKHLMEVGKHLQWCEASSIIGGSMKQGWIVFTTSLFVILGFDPMAHARPMPADNQIVMVNSDNFVRAESDLYFSNIVKDGGFGKFLHRREPSPVDHQSVIRLNRDTLYSAVVIDLGAGPTTITLPDSGKRFMSMQVINEDEYTPLVVYGAGSHTLTEQQMGTRYVLVGIRTLVNPADPKDVAKVHALQDELRIS